MKLSNWNIFFVVLIVIVIILLCVIIGIVLYKTFANEPKPTPKVRTSESKVRILPDRDNKVVLIDGAFHRVDPGLYTKPYHYQGVVHRGPDLVDLNS
jgi:hypothetical protein